MARPKSTAATTTKAAVKAEPTAAAGKEAAKAVETKAAPKTAAKKTAAKAEPTVAVTFEYEDKQIVAKKLLAEALEAFQAAHQDVEVKDMQLYVNANDGYAYIVVNGTEYPEDRIAL